MKWEANLNLPYEALMFIVGGETMYALHDGNMVHWEGYAAIIAFVQNECKSEPSLLGSNSIAYYTLFCFHISIVLLR